MPNHKYLGTRKDAASGGPYCWKTYREVHETAVCFWTALKSHGLIEPFKIEDEDEWKIIGILSNNREEY